jgi:hypothetical protein
MNSYTMHQVGMARQHERLASAHSHREAKLARAAARPASTTTTTDIPTQRPFTWLRDAVGTVASHLTARATQPSRH